MIEWIRQKKINYLHKKACKALAKFDNAIGKDSKNLFMKELLNRVYGKKYMNALFNNEVAFGSISKEIQRDENYTDTDSITDSKIHKIREDVKAIDINGQIDERTSFIRTGEQVKQMVLDIIDKDGD